MIGTLIDARYEIIAEIGVGGMATVYKAVDRKLFRKVAIKILHSHIAKQSEFVQRFYQEASIAAGLIENNIVQIYDYGTDVDGKTFIVSEYINGKNLHQLETERLKTLKKPFHFIFALMVIDEVLNALIAAHSKKYIHRDIKPDNIMITQDGIVKLTDFGIAKNASLSMTVTGSFLGSPIYSSPEQVQMQELDFRTDIFSTGIVLYEILTGVLPFKGSNITEISLKIINSNYLSVNSVYEYIPIEISQIVDKALNKDRNLRYCSVNEMQSYIRKILQKFGVENNKEKISFYFANEGNFISSFISHTALSTLSEIKDINSDITLRKSQKTQINKTEHFKNTQNNLNVNNRKTIITQTRHKEIVPNYNYKNNNKNNNSGVWSGLFVLLLAIIFVIVMYINKKNIYYLAKINPQKNQIILQSNNDKNILNTLPTVVLSQNSLKQEIKIPKEEIKIPKEEIKKNIITDKKNIKLNITKNIPNENESSFLVLLTFPPKSLIYIDNKFVGQSTGLESENKKIELKQGKYKLKIVSTQFEGIDYFPLEKTIFIEKGRDLNIGKIFLVPKRKVNIKFNENNLNVTINEKSYNLKNESILTLFLPDGVININAVSDNTGKKFNKKIDLKGGNLSVVAILE